MADDRIKDSETQTRDADLPRVTRPEVVPCETLMDKAVKILWDAALSTEWNAGTEALARLNTLGLTNAETADDIIPAVARQMGDAWCADTMSFANVTIGVSRLQSMLRDLGPAWMGDEAAPPDAPTILLAVAQDVYHTLGAMVLSGQLRRRGLSVRLMLNAAPADVSLRVRSGAYDAVFISSSCGEKLESLRKIVESVRQAAEDAPAIVIGGTILTEVPNAARLIGADFATNDPDEAIRICGLTDQNRTSALNRQEQ